MKVLKDKEKTKLFLEEIKRLSGIEVGGVEQINIELDMEDVIIESYFLVRSKEDFRKYKIVKSQKLRLFDYGDYSIISLNAGKDFYLFSVEEYLIFTGRGYQLSNKEKAILFLEKILGIFKRS